MTKRALLYARVSTDDQADTGYSLPSQLELCRKYAERLGFAIIAEMREDYSGATPIAERPEGRTMTAMLKSRQADAVIVYQVDRLSRDIVDLLATVRNWIRTGVEVHTCDIGKIESELDIVLVIKGWQGSDERKKILERTLRGKYAKARSGKVVGSPSAPYGFRFEKTLMKSRLVSVAFVIIEEEARIVRMAYVWYTEGDGDSGPLSMWAIAKKLSELRVPTPGETRKIKRTRISGLWKSSQVLRMLTDETYCGVWRYGKRMGRNGRDGARALDEQVAVEIPAIVSRELWKRAQAQRERNKLMARRNCKHEYLLRGMVRCGCGFAMSGRNVRLRYYTCCCNINRISSLEGERCKEKSVRADLIESYAWDYVKSSFSNSRQFERSLRLAQKAEGNALEPKRERLETLSQMIADCEKEATEVARAYAKSGDGAVGRALEAQINDVNARHAALLKERERLQAELGHTRLTDEDIKAAMQFRNDVVVGMKNPTFEDKRRILELLGVQVTVKKGKARVTCKVPIPATIESRTSTYLGLSRAAG